MKKHTVDKRKFARACTVCAIGAAAVILRLSVLFKNRIEIGSQRQFFWNSEIIDSSQTTAALTGHRPVKQDIILTFNSPWEGSISEGFNIVKLEDGYGLYYSTYDTGDSARICFASSRNGISWEKPSLGMTTFNGSTDNNIIFDADRGLTGGFFAFRDTNADSESRQQYKAIGITSDGYFQLYTSADGLHWEYKGNADKKISNDEYHPLNLTSVFWNKSREEYQCFYTAEKSGKQVIMMLSSKDFVNWKKSGVALSDKEYGFASANIFPYYRNENMLIGLPMRRVTVSDKEAVDNFASENPVPGSITDCVFAYSADAENFDISQRAWLSAGPQTDKNWIYGDCFAASGLIQTPSLHSRQGQDEEISVYVAENVLSETSAQLVRYTTRIDGFYSYSAPYSTKKVVTKPIVFDGSRMTLNFSTSTDGYVYVRILDKNGQPFDDITYTDRQGEEYTVPAYTSYKMLGDRVDREVVFNADLSRLSGKSVILEFYLSDADIYSFAFDDKEYETDTQWQPEEIDIRSFEPVTYSESREVIDIGTDRQLFVDDYIIDTENTDAQLTSHSPVMKEEIFKTDLPWEGNSCDFYVIIDDTDSDGIPYYRMYYLGWDTSNRTDIRVCYAYSYDGTQWIKPNLGLHSFTDKETGQTYTRTNIMLYTEEEIFDNFFVFKDHRPGVPDSRRYKAICQGRYDQLGYPSFGLWAWQSADGIHWTKTRRVLPQQEEWFGAFDSVNSLVWDRETEQFFTYFRVRESQVIDGVDYVDFRKIYGATAGEFEPFDTDTVFRLDYGEGSPIFEMYTNNISKYYRAPQLFIGFPTRFSRNSVWEKNYDYLSDPQTRLENYNSGQATKSLSMTDTMFMTSRDGYIWNRQNEAFITPGPEYQANWIYGNCYPAYGLIETPSDTPGADNEISTYLFEGKFYDRPSVLYRYVMRLDGFTSYKGTASRKVTTKTLTFQGSEMYINFKTSAAGSVIVDILDENGNKLDGYSAKLIGDNTDRKVIFDNDLSRLSGKNIKIQFTLNDAEIYSFKFQ